MHEDIRKIDQSERALKVLFLTMLISVVALLIYGGASTSLSRFLSTIGIGLLVVAAALVIGGLLGFLFGIPRTLQQPPANKTDISANAEQPKNVANDNGQKVQFEANTNLEQISDWLTKILVGVGLTQVSAIGQKFLDLSASITSALGDPSGNRTFALALIIVPLVLGFLFSYLWTRLFLPNAFQQADNALRLKVEQIDIRSRDNQAAALGTGKGNSDEVQKLILAAADGIEPGNSEDPWKGKFGGESTHNDRELKAEITSIPGNVGVYSIRLTVNPLHPDANPLKGVVRFFIHPTFKNDRPIVTVGPFGIAELNLKAWGAFTVGVLADDGQTKLELDLSQVLSAPLDFRNR